MRPESGQSFCLIVIFIHSDIYGNKWRFFLKHLLQMCFIGLNSSWQCKCLGMNKLKYLTYEWIWIYYIWIYIYIYGELVYIHPIKLHYKMTCNQHKFDYIFPCSPAGAQPASCCQSNMGNSKTFFFPVINKKQMCSITVVAVNQNCKKNN